ncbi:MAG: class I SAM-dependent methyltransferase [Campylobacterota bacterium]
MNCKICNEPVTAFYDDYMTCQTYHCKACEFIFKDEEAVISLDKERKVYQQHNNTEENLGYVAMFQDFIDKTIIPYKDQIQTALDFGSGPNPVLAKILKRNGFETDHYDKFFSPEKVYEEKSYDLITSTEVMEHISDVQSVMTLFAQHLNTGGFLALMTQFHPDDQEAYLNWWYRRDPTHIVFFRPKSFALLAQQHGFTLRYHDDKKLILLQKERNL